VHTLNQRKIINDPVYGFIKIPNTLIFELIQHPYLQRLRRIKQLGLTNYVYPGANHTRFEHILGAMHLMSNALETLKSKGHNLSEEEQTGALAAILLHDCGHGPFSHTLEHSIQGDVSHEELSLLYMQKLNKQYTGKLQTAIDIFTDKHHKKFLHSLVSGQLDTDRLDYLRRDSFYSGVSEGVIGSDRIIKMLDVRNSEIVIEEKGIYSIEKFLIARRIMYWQVYLHKTVVAAEQMLVKALLRAREIFRERELPASPALSFFLRKDITKTSLNREDSRGKTPADWFTEIDDNDIICALKQWAHDKDTVLSILSQRIIDRNLFKVEIQTTPFEPQKIETLRKETAKKYKLSKKETTYFVFSDTISNKAYSIKKSASINILQKSGKIKDIADASDISNIKTLSETVEKYFICYPKL
jgi:uncharacterized protein